jgi:hypothetical protein
MDNKKILIVDDDPDIRQGMHVRLQARIGDGDDNPRVACEAIPGHIVLCN